MIAHSCTANPTPVLTTGRPVLRPVHLCTPLALALLWTSPLTAQTKTGPTLSLVVASATLSPIGGRASLGAVTLTSYAKSVGVAPAGVMGGIGELMMTAAAPGSGTPASVLTIRSDQPIVAGRYSIGVTFLHGKAGSVRITDANSGAVLTSCTLSPGGWTAAESCGLVSEFPAGTMMVTVTPAAGYELYPGQITISQLR